MSDEDNNSNDMMTLSSVHEINELFSDIEPVKQDDGPHPVCTIDYSPQFVKAYDYMRGILKRREKSERSLKLTGLCLKLNPANYTIWHFRRQCLEEVIQQKTNHHSSSSSPLIIEKLIENDLSLASILGGDNPKNYQIWYHRRALLETIMKLSFLSSPDSSTSSSQTNIFEQGNFFEKERSYIHRVLEQDAKNYHAWSHRQWLVLTISTIINDNNDNHDDINDVWKEELEYAHSLIKEDPRNNSAWNYRWFVCHKGQHNDNCLLLEDAKKEVNYSLMATKLDPYNESPWRYLIGIMREQKQDNSQEKEIILFINETQLKVWEEIHIGVVNDNHADGTNYCSSLLSAYIDILELKSDIQSLETAIQHAENLASKYDTIRKKYWLLRVHEMTTKATQMREEKQ